MVAVDVICYETDYRINDSPIQPLWRQGFLASGAFYAPIIQILRQRLKVFQAGIQNLDPNFGIAAVHQSVRLASHGKLHSSRMPSQVTTIILIYLVHCPDLFQ